MTGAGVDDRRRLPRDVVLLGWVSFFADVSSEMMYPLLPIFVVGVLGASAVSLGWIEGASQFIVAIMTAWVGWRSDRRRRRVPYVRFGYGLPVLGKAIVAAAIAWPMVLAGRLVDRLGKGMRSSPRDALIAQAADEAIRGRAFGFHRAMDTAGALTGVVASAVLLWLLGGSSETPTATADQGPAFRMVFGVAAALGLASLALTWLVRERPAPDAEATSGEGDPPRLSPSYWKTVGVLLIFALANSSDVFVLLRVSDLGYSPWAVVVAYAVYNAIYALLSYPAGAASDRFGRWRLVCLGWAIYAVCYLGLAFTGPRGVWPLLALYGVYMALTDGVAKALVADHAPSARRGTALGVFYMASGLVTLAASVAAGLLWDRVGPSSTFLFGAAMAAVALGVALLLADGKATNQAA